MSQMASSSVIPIAPEGNLSRYLQEIRKFPMIAGGGAFARPALA
jgi:RNA polymerase sigma-32 factor